MMNFNPMHKISIALFGAAFIASVIGPLTTGIMQVGMFVGTVMLLIAGWTCNIIGIIKIRSQLKGLA